MKANELNYTNISKTLKFLKDELFFYEQYSLAKVDTYTDDEPYVSKVVKYYKLAIKVLEERLNCEIMREYVEKENDNDEWRGTRYDFCI